jgi:two-component system response regulator VicR
MSKKLLTVLEVSKFCGVSVTSVRHWIQEGQITATQFQGRGDYWIDVEDLLSHMKRNGKPIPREFQPPERRVLIVEDDPLMAKFIERHLRDAGFDTEIALDGFAAGAAIESFRPGVITLDIKMPGLSGTDVLKFIRSQLHLRKTKVLIISAMPDDTIHEAKRIGADGVLKKPLDAETLVRTVSELAGVPPPS